MNKSSVKLEWIIPDEGANWTEPETSETKPQRPRRRTFLSLALVVIFLSLAGSLLVRRRIDQNQRQLKADIQAMIDLEARAIANGDRGLFQSFKSTEDAAWFDWQNSAFDYYTQHPDDWPQLQVSHAQLVEDYAWVRTTGTLKESGDQFEWVRFYHWIEDTWRHAPPDGRYWGLRQVRDSGPVHLIYHERDAPYLELIEAELTDLLGSLCDDLGCSPSLSLTVRVEPLVSPGLFGATRPDLIVLPSPADWPQPTDASPAIPSVGSRSSILSQYLAFEAAGGKRRWETNPQGAWLVQAAADWAEGRWERRIGGPTWSLQAVRGRELLRLNVRVLRRIPSLQDLWRNSYLSRPPYPAMLQPTPRYVELDGAKARSVIDCIVEIHGREAIPELLAAMSRHNTLEATLQDALGIRGDAFEQVWLTWLETHYGYGRGWRLADAATYWEKNRIGSPPSSLQDNTGHRQYEELMRTAVRGERVLPLVELWQGKDTTASSARETFLSLTNPPQDGSSVHYAQLLDGVQVLGGDEPTPRRPTQVVGYPSTWRKAHALAVVRYVAQVYGERAVYGLLTAIVKNSTFDGALRDALGVGLDDFERGWRAWLEAHYGDANEKVQTFRSKGL